MLIFGLKMTKYKDDYSMKSLIKRSDLLAKIVGDTLYHFYILTEKEPSKGAVVGVKVSTSFVSFSFITFNTGMSVK